MDINELVISIIYKIATIQQIITRQQTTHNLNGTRIKQQILLIHIMISYTTYYTTKYRQSDLVLLIVLIMISNPRYY